MGFKKIGLFALGTLFGSVGVRILSSRDAKKVYTHCTAAALRAQSDVLDTVTTLQENCADIYEEAKAINEERQNREAAAMVDVQATKAADAPCDAQAKDDGTDEAKEAAE